MRAAALLAALPLMTEAANYTAERVTVDGIEVVRLSDDFHKAQVSIAPALGNNAYEFLVNGKNVMWFPQRASRISRRNRPLAATRCSLHGRTAWITTAFMPTGSTTSLNPQLNNYRRDGAKQPIHGLVTYASEWKVANVSADDKGAEVTSRLEFWRYPGLHGAVPVRAYASR